MSADLRQALERVKQVLTVPAAEYVPAIPDAWAIIDQALASNPSACQSGKEGEVALTAPGEAITEGPGLDWKLSQSARDKIVEITNENVRNASALHGIVLAALSPPQGEREPRPIEELVRLIKAHRTEFKSDLQTAKTAVQSGWRPGVVAPIPADGEHVRSSADEQLIDQARDLYRKINRSDDLASEGMWTASHGWQEPPGHQYWSVTAVATPTRPNVKPYKVSKAITQDANVAALLTFMSTALPRLCDLADQALASPSDGERERIARIIDPEAWEEYLLEDGRVDQEVASIFQDAYELSLAKADAILAALSHKVEATGAENAQVAPPDGGVLGRLEEVFKLNGPLMRAIDEIVVRDATNFAARYAAGSSGSMNGALDYTAQRIREAVLSLLREASSVR